MKNIFKYIQENEKNDDLERAKILDINSINNLELFDYLREKIANSIYSSILISVFKVIAKNRVKFGKLSVLEQCKVLKQIIFAFRCNLVPSDLRDINGSEKTGMLKMSRLISKHKKFMLIHQSVTGLFEKEVDLLK